MVKIVIDCKNLTKTQINEQIENKTRGLESIELRISNYEYNDFVGIKLNIVNMNVFSCRDNKITSFEGLKLNPDSLLEFYCSDNQITSFTGLILPNSLTNFYCSYNRITSYFVADGLAGLKLPNSLTEFSCSNNQITSFDRLILPSSLEYFDCFNNKITSFDELKLPESIREFNCYNNKITSFTGLTLPPLLTFFRCSENQITVVKDFEFPTNIISLTIDGNVKFINPKFNSVLRVKLRNKVEFDNKLRYDDLNYRRNLLFLYLNFSMTYDQYNHILDELAS